MRRWKVATLVLGIALVGALYWGYTREIESRRLGNFLNAQYTGSFLQVVGHVNNLGVLMGKVQVANSTNQTLAALTDIWRHAWSAQDHLSRMPINQGAQMRTSKFLTQVGDFSYVIARKRADGIPLDASDRKRIADLRRQSLILGRELQRIQTKAVTRRFDWRAVQAGANTGLRETSKDFATSEFRQVDKAMVDYTTLQYDGPFSDHIAQIQPRGLTGPVVSRDEAGRIATKVVTDPGRYTVRYKGLTRGKVPSYGFELVPNTGEVSRIAVDVSRKGGHIVWMTRTRPLGATRMTAAQAIGPAQDFLKRVGYTSMVHTYSGITNGFATVPFIFLETGNILVYPDQVKVQVALDTGEVIGFDALSYLSNHHDRNIAPPKLTDTEARAKVNPKLVVATVSKAIIPLEVAGKDVLTWEFKGTLDGEEYFTYINAYNGREERILKIVNTSQGTLAQ